ncbi:MAG TPA: hypothetical protein VNH18_06455 [Bryobacteraceae bacterium]|nr:hypothetical protein [Bryobacteraceae bacterium]
METLTHKSKATYLVSLGGRSQLWKIDNLHGIAVYCRDLMASEPVEQYQRDYRPATKEQCEQLARGLVLACVLKVGHGFHPDTPAAGYVKLGTNGERSFTDAECERLDGAVQYAFDTIGEEAVYEVLEANRTVIDRIIEEAS